MNKQLLHIFLFLFFANNNYSFAGGGGGGGVFFNFSPNSPMTEVSGIGGGGGTLSSIADGNGSGNMSSIIVNAGNGSGTMSYVDFSKNGGSSGGVRPELELAGGRGGGGVFENPILVKFLSEKASEIKFGVAVKENGSWTTEVHSLRPEEFTADEQNILEAISVSKIKNGNWVKSK